MIDIVERVCNDFNIKRNQAVSVISSLLSLPRPAVYIEELDETSYNIIKVGLLLMKKDVPIEYITKTVQFRNFKLSIWSGVFIPRIESEYIIDLIQKHVSFMPERILEVGTGTGALAISLAELYPGAHIIATDISQQAVQCTAYNVIKHSRQHRIHVVNCSMCDAISGQFDMIISNPPYIPTSRLRMLPKSVKEFEPISALDGGKGGIQFISMLLDQAIKILKKNRVMCYEIDHDQKDVLGSILFARGFKSFVFERDLFGRYRYLFIRS